MGAGEDESRQAILALIAELDALEASGAIEPGQANALRAHLRNALHALERGNLCAARAQLEAFGTLVRNLSGAGVLGEDEADSLEQGLTDVLDPPALVADHFSEVVRTCWFADVPDHLWAADFVTASTWRIARVEIQGEVNPALPVPVSIRADDGGVPGTVLHQYELLATRPAVNRARFDLPSPVTLDPGRYWVVVNVWSDPVRTTWCDVETSNGTEGMSALEGGPWTPYLLPSVSYENWPRKDLSLRVYGRP